MSDQQVVDSLMPQAWWDDQWLSRSFAHPQSWWHS